MKDIDILILGAPRAVADAHLGEAFTCHRAASLDAVIALPAAARERIRAVAAYSHAVRGPLIDALPKLEIAACFGVGYDGVDTAAAAARGVIVTNTPDVLTEEVADTALGLLLMTVRELPAAERHLRAGKWEAEGPYPLTRATMRNRTVGIVGYGRIGEAIARRLDAMQVPVAYHSRNERSGVDYRYYASLMEMAREVDTLVSILPGGAETRHVIDAEVLAALGPEGVLVNIGRGSAVDEQALIAALRDGTIFAAGLDVFENEPHVPDELIALPNAVLLPHVGSASEATRDDMAMLVVENLVSWFGEGKPLTPVAETPWPPTRN